MFCSVVPIRDTHKSPKIVCGLRTPSVECSKLGKTRIITDAVTGWLEMPHFLNRMFHRHSTRNLHVMLPIILLIAKGPILIRYSTLRPCALPT